MAPVESKGLRENKTSPHAAFSASKKTKFDAKKAKQSTTADVPPRGFLDIVRRVPRRPTVDTVQPVPAPPENSTTDSSEQAELNEKDEMIMEALTNMTTSVQQAVSYFRNTAHLLEVILSNTDMLVDARVPQSEDETPLPFQGGDRFQVPGEPFSTGPGGFEVRGAIPGNGNGKLPVGERAFPGNRRTELPAGERIFPGNRRTELPFGDRIFLGNRKTELPVGDVQSSKQGEKNCEVPVEVVGSWSNLMKNGSQLLEVCDFSPYRWNCVKSKKSRRLKDMVRKDPWRNVGEMKLLQKMVKDFIIIKTIKSLREQNKNVWWKIKKMFYINLNL